MTKIRRPSATVVVSIIAVVVALAGIGTAVAGGGFVTKKKFNTFKATAITAPLTYVATDTSIPGGAPGPYTSVSATCPAGTKSVDGGIKIPNPSSGTVGPAAVLYDGYPTATGYAGHVRNSNAAAVTATTFAYCAIVPSTAGTPPAS